MVKKKHKTMWSDQQMNPCDVQERINGYVEMVQGKMTPIGSEMVLPMPILITFQ